MQATICMYTYKKYEKLPENAFVRAVHRSPKRAMKRFSEILVIRERANDSVTARTVRIRQDPILKSTRRLRPAPDVGIGEEENLFRTE